MSAAILKILFAYLLGSVSGSLLIGRLRQVDIRTLGSGNAGGTNALRTQGWRFALGVVLIDIGKGALAAGWIPRLPLPGDALNPEVLMLVCGLAAVVGHCLPAWHGFRGGKGAATSIGVLAVVNPLLLLPMVLCWLLVVVISGYVGLATVLAGFALLPAAWWLQASPLQMTFLGVIAVLMAWNHRANFRRMRAGRESRFERARLSHWLRRR